MLIPETLVLSPARRVGTLKAESPVRWLLVGGGEIIDELPQKLIVHAGDTPFVVVAAEMAGVGLASCVVSVEKPGGWKLPKIPLPSWGTVKALLPWAALLVLLAVLWMKPGPGPEPGPNPPGPNPPAPIVEKGFRALIVYESADRLPPAQTAILTARPIREYLDLRCISGPGGNKEWRFWDKDVSTANVSKLWQDAFARVKASDGPYPKILISNGVTGFVGPLPATVDETMSLLKTYGGV